MLLTLSLLKSHPSHDGDGLEGEESGVADFIIDDAVEHFLFVIPGKRRFADEHFEDEDTEAPPVHRSRVRCLRQDFRRQKLWSPAKSSGSISVPHALLAQAEIGDFDVTFGVQQ